jgi:hypothetical protein
MGPRLRSGRGAVARGGRVVTPSQEGAVFLGLRYPLGYLHIHTPGLASVAGAAVKEARPRPRPDDHFEPKKPVLLTS